jgi:Tol biopolymer transport system component
LVADVAGVAYEPDWSPDGTEIAFHAVTWEGARKRYDLYVVSAEGGTPTQVADWRGYKRFPDWSPDGRALAFAASGPHGDQRAHVWIISRDSVGDHWGEPIPLHASCAGIPNWSPDGADVLCVEWESSRWVLVSRDGELLSQHDASTVGLQGFDELQFSPDGSRVYAIGTGQDGSRGVWWIPTGGGSATKVVAFDDPSLTVLWGLSVGEEHLYLTIAEYESDIWVVDLEW